MSVAPDVTRAQVESELAELQPWVTLHGWELEWDREALQFTVRMRSKVDAEAYVLELKLDSYRALPPFIEFLHPSLAERGTRRCYPGGGRGYFHTHPVICAPWNRKAYAAHGGPHSDWAMANWATYRPNHSQLGDMLVLIQDLLDDRSSYSGRMEK
jgi:hypothetical protein